jgi:hypothetical protein
MSKFKKSGGKKNILMKINKVWHLKNKMTKNPKPEERIKWHLAHAKHCLCRPMSEKLKEEIKNFKQKKS